MKLISPDKQTEVLIDLKMGGRVSSLCIDGVELLRTADPVDLNWGIYPMAPWAGRVRNGQFEFDGNTYQLSLNDPPHALHGTCYAKEWTPISDCAIRTVLGNDDGWPFTGSVIQYFGLENDALKMLLRMESDMRCPFVLGYHPWFLHQTSRGSGAHFDFNPGKMFIRDEDGIQTGDLALPSRGPWDDCFCAVDIFPTITWPGFLRLQLSANTDYWVVYNQQKDAFCAEPQSGPPNAFNFAPEILKPGSAAELIFELKWKLLS